MKRETVAKYEEPLIAALGDVCSLQLLDSYQHV